MSLKTIYLSCDDEKILGQAKSLLQSLGVNVESYTLSQWKEVAVSYGWPQLTESKHFVSSAGTDSHNNVLPFPGMTNLSGDQQKVATINEMEMKAIKNAISQFNGNLTEASKALGIGRATLYRKVKQYKIDTSQSRKKKVA